MSGKNKPPYPPHANIKGLVQDLVESLDAHMRELCAGTELARVRPSDAKTFMLAARHPRSTSEIARALNVSRQAAHMSVGRLVEMGVVELVSAPSNRRDKIVTVTEKGHNARQLVAQKLQVLEAYLAADIGAERLDVLRQILMDLVESYRRKRTADSPPSGGRGVQ